MIAYKGIREELQINSAVESLSDRHEEFCYQMPIEKVNGNEILESKTKHG